MRYMKQLRSVYERSPIFFQQFMTSVYGYKIHRERYGGVFDGTWKALEASQWQPREKLQAQQLNQLRKLLQHAYEHIPFYRERFNSVGFHPRDLQMLDDLRRIPVLTRDDIYQNVERMVTENIPRSQLRQHFTSGTTSTPLMVYETLETLQKNYAFWMRFRRWFGFEPWMPRATLSGRVVVPREQRQPPFWRYNPTENQLVMSSFHLSDETIPYYLKRMEEFQPYVIDGYVSTTYTLAKYINRHGGTIIRPRAVQTTSETLLDHHREEIEKAFRCKVYNQYSHGEKAVFITECEHDSLHINDEYGVVEILDQHGEPTQPGDIGDVIVTGFLNDAMPLIRFQTGDIAVPTAKTKCQCGRGLSMVERVEGRVIDILKMPDGKIVPPTALTLLFDKAEALDFDRAQVVQTDPDRVVVRIVPRIAGITPDTSTLERDLRMMMGEAVNLQFQMVDDIPRTSTGKYKFVVSELQQ